MRRGGGIIRDVPSGGGVGGGQARQEGFCWFYASISSELHTGMDHGHGCESHNVVNSLNLSFPHETRLSVMHLNPGFISLRSYPFVVSTISVEWGGGLPDRGGDERWSVITHNVIIHRRPVPCENIFTYFEHQCYRIVIRFMLAYPLNTGTNVCRNKCIDSSKEQNKTGNDTMMIGI